MLASDGRRQNVIAWIDSLPCHVNFPANIRENFDKTGPAPAVSDDLRGNLRVYCCGNNHRAGLQIRQSLPALPRETAWHAVYTTNFSKHGCGFFHSQLLYPGERFTLVLLNSMEREVEVAWCRRIDANCFAVGSRFAECGASSSTGE